jgi:hypothetical protein
MKIILTEEQILKLKTLIKEGVNPDDWVKAFLLELGIGVAKNSTEINDILSKNPISVKIPKSDGSIETIICKTIDDLIIASEKLSYDELNFASGIKKMVKENPNLKIDFSTSLYRGDFNKTIDSYLAVRNKLSTQNTKPTPIINDLPKQKIAESDVDAMLKTNIEQTLEYVDSLMGKVVGETPDETKFKEFEIDFDNLSKSQQDIQNKIGSLEGLRRSSEKYYREMKKLFSEKGGVYDKNSANFDTINKLIDESSIKANEMIENTKLQLLELSARIKSFSDIKNVEQDLLEKNTEWLKNFKESFGIVLNKEVSDVDEALEKTPISVNVLKDDGTCCDKIVCKSVNEIINATKKGYSSEENIKTLLNNFKKNNPKIKVNIANSIFKFDVNETVMNFLVQKKLIDPNQIYPVKISNELPNQQVAEQDVATVVQQKVDEITKQLDQLLGNFETSNVKIDMSMIPQTSAKLKENLTILVNLKYENQTFFRELSNMFENYAETYEKNSVDFTNIQKFIDDFSKKTDTMVNDAYEKLATVSRNIEDYDITLKNQEPFDGYTDGPLKAGYYEFGADISDEIDIPYTFNPMKSAPFNLPSIEGKINSQDFNEDFINWKYLENEAPPPAAKRYLGDEFTSYKDYLLKDMGKHGPDPEFPESSYQTQLMRNIKRGLEDILSGRLEQGLGYLPKSGFENYGITDFKNFIKKAYEENRLLIDYNKSWDVDDDPDNFRFSIELRPEPGKTSIDVNKIRDYLLKKATEESMEEPQDLSKKIDYNRQRSPIILPSKSKIIDADILKKFKDNLKKRELNNSYERTKGDVIQEIRKSKKLIYKR